MRPLVPRQKRLVREFLGTNVVVYAIDEGTILPEGLILVDEGGAHCSLQPAVEMSLRDLNEKISDFLKGHATLYTRNEWIAKFDQS
ncbi:hypothetical protein E4U31_000514 [Claviceps sp. LM219 group G6]|nr:hypothetical protein E4U31_000514 [Claviceps sp. LM219 group G6]